LISKKSAFFPIPHNQSSSTSLIGFVQNFKKKGVAALMLKIMSQLLSSILGWPSPVFTWSISYPSWRQGSHRW
jgi:hypothetical protein